MYQTIYINIELDGEILKKAIRDAGVHAEESMGNKKITITAYYDLDRKVAQLSTIYPFTLNLNSVGAGSEK